MIVTGHDVDYDDSQRTTYQGRPYTGTVQESAGSGQLLAESNYLEGIEHGVSRTYYMTGQVKQERWYEYGRYSGTHRYWHENGRLEKELIYEDGKLVDRHAWAEDGTPVDPRTHRPLSQGSDG